MQICYSCFQEKNQTKPLRFKMGSIGYLRVCKSCYWKKKFSDLGVIAGLCTILGVSILGITLLWNAKIGLGRYGLCILIIYFAFLIIRFFLTLDGSAEIEKTILELRRAAPYDDLISRGKRIGRMLLALILSLLHISVLILLWICYFRFGYLLSSGKNPENYTVITKHIGGDTTSTHAFLIDVDPLPIVILVVLVIVTVLYFWYIRNYPLWKIGHYARKPISGDDLRRKQASIKNFKVYKDPQFSQVDDDLTESLFVGKLY